MYDIAIVGGGLVGASLAVALARLHHYKIVLIEAKSPNANDARLFALNIHSERFLEKIGLWSKIKTNASVIQEVHVSREGQFGTVRFRPEEIDLSHLGHVVPASLLETELHASLLAESQLTMLQPASVQHLRQEKDTVVFGVKREEQIEEYQAKIVIAADGLFSFVRDQVQIECERSDYEEVAIVSKAVFNQGSVIAEQRLLHGGGTLAVLPLQDKERAVILTASQNQAEELLSLSEEKYGEFLNERISGRQGNGVQILSRHHYPLQLMRAKQTVSGRVALLGNATHAMHPIAAQGFNLALFEAAVLSSMLQEYGCTVEALQKFSHRSTPTQKNSVRLSHWLSRAANCPSFLLDWPFQTAFFALRKSRFLRKKLLRRLLVQ